MKLHQQPFNRNSSRNSSRRNSRCCSCSRARTKPKAGTGSNCNSNAQEQDKQQTKMQKQHPELAEQAPPHEITSAALQQKQHSRSKARRNSRCCSQHPMARTKPKAGTGTYRHQLQLKCAGARQAAHRITEAASTNGRASTST